MAIMAGDTADGGTNPNTSWLVATPEEPGGIGGGSFINEIGNRHNGGMNTAWSDGHAQWNKRQELWDNGMWYVGWKYPIQSHTQPPRN